MSARLNTLQKVRDEIDSNCSIQHIEADGLTIMEAVVLFRKIEVIHRARVQAHELVSEFENDSRSVFPVSVSK